jgi:hypothetical protein
MCPEGFPLTLTPKKEKLSHTPCPKKDRPSLYPLLS